MEANITNKSHASTPRKRQSTAYLGYMNSTQDVKVTFSLTGSSSTHNLCSEYEIPTKLAPILKSYLRAAKNYLEGRSLPTPGIERFRLGIASFHKNPKLEKLFFKKSLIHRRGINVLRGPE